MTFENGGGDVNGVQPENYTFPVYYKLADDPLAFGAAEAMPIVTGDGIVPVSSPYNIYDEETGWLIVSCGTLEDVFVNKDGGKVGSWESRGTGEGVSYTRSLRIVEDDEGGKGLLIAGGGMLPPSQGNAVTVGMVDMSGW